MIKKIKNKCGMTLVELIAVLFIFSIIGTSVSAVLVPTLRAFARANDLAEMNTLMDNLTKELLNDLSTAKDIDEFGLGGIEIKKANGARIAYVVGEIIDIGDDPVFMPGAQGYLHRGDSAADPSVFMPVLVLAPGFYKNKAIEIVFDVDVERQSICTSACVPPHVPGCIEVVLSAEVMVTVTVFRMISPSQGLNPANLEEMVQRDYAVRPLLMNRGN
jgi:prepilin-type N-terminal cleavage/methylation domain-containing protein